MKKLITGNEAVARGIYEAGVHYAAAYPGTPSTEILENVALFKDSIKAEWAPNEKVALESAIGASIAGARSIAAMKHVGVNVAADPLFTYAYTGVNGGLVLITADDPGMHSSQNEQDNRRYAKFAKIPMVEPSDSQESKDMVAEAIKISEKFDMPVLFRMTTRVCHSKGLVDMCERMEVPVKAYEKNIAKYVATPANGRKLHVELERKLKEVEKFSNQTELNYFEWNNKDIGIISSGVAYQYAKEVFGDKASYLKLGFTFPLPLDKIKSFASEVGKLYVIEELEPYIEEQLKEMGIDCVGKSALPICGELNPDIIAKALLGSEREMIEKDSAKIVGRPPTMCAGCPHRGLFYELSKRKDVMVTGDIGCYTLGSAPPLGTMETCICMGASISAGHGAQQAFEICGEEKRVFSVIGDSTFFHSGMTSLLDVAYNQSKVISVILDNRITGMTGHQENPGSGYTLQQESANAVDLVQLCKAIGIKNVKVVNPIDLKETKEAIDWALSIPEASVIITRWPCALKKLSLEDKAEFGGAKSKCVVDEDKCVGCKVCVGTGCPALSYSDDKNIVGIDEDMCMGCEVCMQVCPVNAIGKVGE